MTRAMTGAMTHSAQARILLARGAPVMAITGVDTSAMPDNPLTLRVGGGFSSIRTQTCRLELPDYDNPR